MQPPGHENWRLFWFQIQIIARTTYLKDSQGQRNKSSHENSDILEILLMLRLGAGFFRYKRSLSHSPNSKPAPIDVSKHGAKRISRNRSKYHFLYQY